ncbi:MAG: BCCT family transporter [Gammaproteobacteria bacterium]|nr:BCCT family transporter [Gammaproteobacteria bacterium]
MLSKESRRLIDKPTFFGALVLLLSVTIPLLLFQEEGEKWVQAAHYFVTYNFGSLYLALGLGAFFFMLYVAFSRIGRIYLGDPDEEPEFGMLSWCAMLFCAGVGAGIMYWAPVEWVYYYKNPPFFIEPESAEALRWASTYGIFHWGPLAWSLYLVPALPIAYFFHVRHGRVLKVSEAIAPVIGARAAHSFGGKMIDVLFVFGMLGGGATALGFAAPLINQGLHELLGVPINISIQIIVLMVCTAIFGASAYSGLKKGIQNLSRINIYLAFLLMGFVFIAGPTVFLADASLESIGVLLGKFIQMSTWIEPFGGFGEYEDTQFPQNWTIFYWAWWLAYAPTIGLFIARISRGRTMGSMILGALFFGTLGCALFFMTIGNYGIYLHISDSVDVVGILTNDSHTAAVFAVLGALPMKSLVIGVFTLLTIIFLATTFDSISYTLASVVQVDVHDEPMRWNRLFWAGAMSLMPVSLMFLGGLNTLQTASIVAGAPLIIVAILLCISTLKVTRHDLARHDSQDQDRILLDDFAKRDPWAK